MSGLSSRLTLRPRPLLVNRGASLLSSLDFSEAPGRGGRRAPGLGRGPAPAEAPGKRTARTRAKLRHREAWAERGMRSAGNFRGRREGILSECRARARVLVPQTAWIPHFGTGIRRGQKHAALLHANFA